MAKVKTFKTIFPAVSVPLNDDYSINEPEFRAYLRWIKSFYGKGIEGLVCNGHTGEITGLTRAERKRVVEICAEECGDKMTIISGVNCENTAESIEMAKEAKEAGADGILLMPPHMWLRFGMNPNAPFEYIKDVAEGADIDIIIHLYPATSKAFYPVETLIKMCKEIDHVKCIKMGTRVTSIYEHDVRLLRQECPDISLITCHDETLCVSWFPGMDGALIGFAGCVPELICPAWDVFSHPEKHTLKEAQDWSNRIYHISQAIYGGGLNTQLAGSLGALLATELDVIVVANDLGLNKAALKVGVDDAGGLRGGRALTHRPGLDLHLAGRKERLQAEQLVGCLREHVQAGLLQAQALQVVGSVLGIELGKLGLNLGADRQRLDAIDGRQVLVEHILVHVGHIQDGLHGEQEQALGGGALLVSHLHGCGALALVEPGE